MLVQSKFSIKNINLSISSKVYRKLRWKEVIDGVTDESEQNKLLLLRQQFTNSTVLK